MSYGYPPVPHPKRPISGADLAISIIALVLTAIVGGGGALMGLLLLAFLDVCPPERCNVDGAVTAIFTAVVVAGVVALIGAVLTIVQLIRRVPAWPFAVATLGLCALALVAGGIGYDSAVGG